jgi:hypothetical protein
MTDRPVSAVLLSALWSRVQQRGLVVWLDPDQRYTRFVDGLGAEELPAPLVRYRGSFVRLLREVAPHAQQLGPSPLVVHLPGLSEETVQRTPALELAAAGLRWVPDLAEQVRVAATGRVPPEELTAWLAEPHTLEEADAWLATHLAESAVGLAPLLERLTLPELVDQLGPRGALAGRMAHPALRESLWDHLHRRVGLPSAWPQRLAPADTLFAAPEVVRVLVGWALCVECLHEGEPLAVSEPMLQPIAALPAEAVRQCRALASHLREQRPALYPQVADWITATLQLESHLAQVPGATFCFQDDLRLVRALQEGEEPARSFWWRQDEARQASWRLVRGIVRMRKALRGLPRLPARAGLEEALSWYTDRAEIDAAHRLLEQDRQMLLVPALPQHDLLLLALDEARAAWQDWSVALADETAELYKRRGYLSERSSQQRTLFDETVRRVSDPDGPVAYLLVEAMRYELGVQLQRALQGPGTTVELGARWAELPSVPEVGLSALAPVTTASGTLRPAEGLVGGLWVGEYLVHSAESRKRAMQDRVGGATCPWLTLREVTDRDATSLKLALTRARIVVVHVSELAAAGEAGLGLDLPLQRVREAWLRLREAGVRRFVITADRGFLYGPPGEPRWALAPGVPLSALGYEGVSGEVALAVRPGEGRAFVGGGASLQERALPVLLAHSAREPGTDGVRYEMRLEPAAGGPWAADSYCLQITVQPIGDVLFAGRTEIEILLEAPGGHLVEAWVPGDLPERGLRVPTGQPTRVHFRLCGPPAQGVPVVAWCLGGASAQPTFAGTWDCR